MCVAVFFMTWFLGGGQTRGLASSHDVGVSLDGWHALSTTRWILLVTIVVSVTLVLLTALQRAPALPVVVGMLTCVIGGLSSLLLLYRVIHHPGLSARAGVYVGAVAALAVTYGGYRSLREEGSSFGDPRSIETVAARGRSQRGAAKRTEPTSAGRPGP